LIHSGEDEIEDHGSFVNRMAVIRCYQNPSSQGKLSENANQKIDGIKPEDREPLFGEAALGFGWKTVSSIGRKS